MYKTNSSNYGEFLPMPQFFPCYYNPREQVFSSHIRATGFYQNNTLNTAPDRTRTLDFPNFQLRIQIYIEHILHSFMK